MGRRTMGRRRMLIAVLSLAAVLLLGVVGLFVARVTSKRPDNLGLQDGRLAELSDSPNAVSTQTALQTHLLQPLVFTGSPRDARARLKRICLAMPGTALESEDDNYLHFEFSSRLFGFVDDVEFLIDPDTQRIHFRSASRVGHSDLGVNRQRMEQIRQAFD